MNHLVLLPYAQTSLLAQLGPIIFAALNQIIEQDLDAAGVLAEAQAQCKAIFIKP